jgi:hypothetical protein
MARLSGAHVLLGAMAPALDADRQSPEDGREPGTSGLDGAQLPRTVAPVAHLRHTARDVQ